jgi:anti-sigma factor RsiW
VSRRDLPQLDHQAIRPFLAARPGELEPDQARQLTEHLSRCPACAAEAAGFHRLALALRAMRELELEPPPGLLDGLVAAALRPRTNHRLVAAAAGAGGALVATAVVAGVLRSRRRDSSGRRAVPARSRLRPALARRAVPARPRLKPALARLLRRPSRPALDVPVLGAVWARAR